MALPLIVESSFSILETDGLKRNEMQQLSHLGTLYTEAKNLIINKFAEDGWERIIDDHNFEFYKECLLFP